MIKTRQTVYFNSTSLFLKVVLIALLFSGTLKSQDIHFSQFFMTDLSTNPALTGVFSGDYRLSGVHRTQWRSVTAPFSTFQLTADANDFKKKKGLGLGLRIFNDRAGDSKFNTFSISAAISKSSPLNETGDLTLHSGVQIGFTQKRIDYSSLRFDQQFNGLAYDGSLDNGELGRRDKVSHADVHVGLLVRRELALGRTWSIGVSAWNLNTPDVSFKDDVSVYLRQRLAIHGDYSIAIDDTWDVAPGARLMLQGPYQEILAGGRLRYTWSYDALSKRRVYIGGFSRLRDGAFIAAGLERDEWIIGLSYDINLSPLEVASRNRGAYEVTAIYIFDVFNETRVLHKKCMDIL